MRRMDTVYWNIIKLWDIVEEAPLSKSFATTPCNIPINPQKLNLLPPLSTTNVDIVWRLLGGTVREEITKLTFDEKKPMKKPIEILKQDMWKLTVWSGVSGSSNVKGLLDEMRLRYKSRRSSSSTSRRSSRTISTPPLMGTRRSSTGRVTRSMKKQRSAAFSIGVSELISYAGQWGSGDQEPFKEGAKLDLWQPNAALGTKISVPSQSWQMRSGEGGEADYGRDKRSQ